MKTCLIFGVGPGMGMALVKKYKSEGFQTIAISRNREKLNRFLEASLIQGVEVFEADGSDSASVKKTISEIQSKFGSIDTFIYNAAAMDNLGFQGSFHELPSDKLMSDFQTSVGSAFLISQMLVQGMKDKKSGTILFTGGGYALYPQPKFGSLSLGKAGIRCLSQLLHDDLKPFGINVGTVTIAGMVGGSSHFSAETIADTFFNFKTLSNGAFEIIYK